MSDLNRERIRILDGMDQKRVIQTEQGFILFRAPHAAVGTGGRCDSQVKRLVADGHAVYDPTTRIYEVTDKGRAARIIARNTYAAQSVKGPS